MDELFSSQTLSSLLEQLKSLFIFFPMDRNGDYDKKNLLQQFVPLDYQILPSTIPDFCSPEIEGGALVSKVPEKIYRSY
jgi:hypothetical protein